MTVTDFDGSLGRPVNAKVATTLDAAGFWDLVVGALASFGRTKWARGSPWWAR